MKTSKIIIIILFVIATILGIAYKLYDVKTKKIEEINLVKESKSATPVKTVTVELSSVNKDFTYQGSFEPFCEVTISSESSGKIINYAVNEGDFVNEGSIIANLDNDISGYQLESAEAVYLKAQKDMYRFEKLSTCEAVTEQQMDEMKLALVNSKCNYFILKKQHENASMKAPISGTISKVYFKKGSLVAPGSPVIDLIDTRKMKFNAKFSASDLCNIHINQKVLLTTDLYPDVIYNGVIKMISVKPDNSKRYLVEAEVENNTDKPLLSGIDGLIHVKNLGKPSLVIPRNCIIGSMVQPMVYVVKKNQVELRKINISSIIDHQVIVLSGLTVGEKVVLSGQINLVDKAKIVE
ncbi:MAG: hypothetical protein CVU05_07425 [Bacteroidetes bacterium HGW-Bacteroidetes-21]|nr:MAG: hypothetical protein CVU05_07425 [Bacteroidetes bacterium HGW-Bacteroidetes-21]